MNQPELGRKILELRQNQGLTQGELAEICNLSLRTVQRIESAEVTPRSYTIKAVLSSLGYGFNNSSIGNHNTILSNSNRLKPRLEQVYKYVFELLNFKKNTMKKLSILSLIGILIIAGLLLIKNDLQAQKIDGWFLSGSEPDSYSIGIDKSIFKTGGSSSYLKSSEKKVDGFGTLMQTCSAEEYLGRRIKMTAYIKTSKVEDWVGMWLRVDPRFAKKYLSFDNMQDRPIKGTNDWTKYEIILDVPEESGSLNFGVLLSGTGKVWFDNVTFETVDILESKTTNEKTLSKKPVNLDFGQ